MKIGIDASRNRSGGAIAHLCGILKNADPLSHGIHKVHIWSYQTLLDALPDASWLIKHNPPELQRSLIHQVWWQYHSLPTEARNCGCNILLNTDAGSVCPFIPAVVISQDMLSYEKHEMRRYGFSRARLRLILLRTIQTRSMKHADGVIFLTNYAARTIQGSIGKLRRVAVIPHGVGDNFKQITSTGFCQEKNGKEIRCLYVSNTEMYKHQWVVVKAIGYLRRRGYNVSLLIVGGSTGYPQRLLEKEIARTDPQRKFIETRGFLPHKEIPGIIAQADIFIFASSCENMPNTLVEAMAGGIPIACSDKGPMPEILENGGVYFDPENPDSIVSAIENIIINRDMRAFIAKRAMELAGQYSWARCSRETFAFLRECIQQETHRA